MPSRCSVRIWDKGKSLKLVNLSRVMIFTWVFHGSSAGFLWIFHSFRISSVPSTNGLSWGTYTTGFDDLDGSWTLKYDQNGTTSAASKRLLMPGWCLESFHGPPIPPPIFIHFWCHIFHKLGSPWFTYLWSLQAVKTSLERHHHWTLAMCPPGQFIGPFHGGFTNYSTPFWNHLL